MDPTEVRQMVKYKQCVVVIDTSPPIKAGFPPYAVQGQRAIPNNFGNPRLVSLLEAEEEHLRKVAQRMRAQQVTEAVASMNSEVEPGDVEMSAGSVTPPPRFEMARPPIVPETTVQSEAEVASRQAAPAVEAGLEIPEQSAVSAREVGPLAAADDTGVVASPYEAGNVLVNSREKTAASVVVLGSVVEDGSEVRMRNYEPKKRSKWAAPDPNQPALFYTDQAVKAELEKAVASQVGTMRATTKTIKTSPTKAVVTQGELDDTAILNSRQLVQDSLR
jgi:hypothetical protein